MPSVIFTTHGCRLNQAETSGLIAQFREHGYRITDRLQDADVFVLNSCVVTGRSASKCLKEIRRVRSSFPDVTIVLTGCFANLADERLRTLPGLDYVIGNLEKYRIFDYFRGPGKNRKPEIYCRDYSPKEPALFRAGDFERVTRAAIKVQSGCSSRCSYCIVPHTRGPSRSVPESVLLAEAARLQDAGFREIVLTGVHIGEYGKDLTEKTDLESLLKKLTAAADTVRFRLSSLNCSDITHGFITSIAENEAVCRHFHLSLQSGSGEILRAMNRGYSAGHIREAVGKLVQYVPGAGLGADIITGFPGENDALFEETAALLEDLPLTYLHVFPFSIRPGTSAADMQHQVPARIKKARAAALRALADRKKRLFQQGLVGTAAAVLFESRNDSGWMSGFTSEYVRVTVPYDSSLINQIVPVRLTGFYRGLMTGQPL